jgi:hypothetical protein
MASGLTTTYLLPYPLQTDSVDVAGDTEALAVAVETELLLKAPLSSPSLTGTPTAPTAGSDTSTTQIATTEYVVNQGYLKIADASSTYAPLASPSLTGTPTAPTATLGTDTTQIATTEYVQNELNNFVTLPDQTGANGYFLTSDGTNAAWQEITIDDVADLTNTITGLSTVYAPRDFTVQTVTGLSAGDFSTSDANNLFILNNSLSTGVQLPLDSTLNFPVGTSMAFTRTNGLVTFSGESGVTVLTTPGSDLRAVGSFATAIKYAADSWVVAGDLI